MAQVDDVAGRLDRLAAEERALSARRARLQDRIDFLRSGGGASSEDLETLLGDLERQERELSQRRRELHEQMDARGS